MRGMLVLLTVVAVLLLGLVSASQKMGTVAQESTPDPMGQRFVGSWRGVAVSALSGQESAALASLTSDGIFLSGDLPVLPAAPGAPFTATHVSGGHGAWESTGERSAAFTFVELATDETGTPQGSATISGTVELNASGDRWSGEYALTVVDPAGNVLFTDTGTHQATRIVVEPIGTPTAATPAAATPTA